MDKSDFADIEIEDNNTFYGSKEKGKKEMIFEAFQTCMKEGAKEMTESGVIRRMVNGRVEEWIAPDQRQVFQNSIKMLWSSLRPIIFSKYNKECIKEIGNFGARCKELKKDYNKSIDDLKPLEKKGIKVHSTAMMNKNNYENSLLELYREKFDFCVWVLEQENWFGVRDA